MNVDQAKLLIEALGSKPAHYDGGDWVKAPCPLARWTHQKGKDSNPSFGIFVKEGEHSHFHCFSCHSGKLFELIQIAEMHIGKTPAIASQFALKQARQIIENEDVAVLPLPEYQEFNPNAYDAFEEWPEWFIESFIPWNKSFEATQYLKSRGMTKELAFKHNLRYDPERGMIVHPYYTVYGKLAGARGRAIENGKYNHHDYTWNGVNNAALCWYNEGVLNSDAPVVIVEGQWDSYAVERAYPQVLANLTAKPSAFKMRRLQQSSGIIPMMDNDATGDTALKRYVEYAEKYNIPCCPVILPKEYTPDGTLIKLDPDKMGTDWIRNKLEEIGLLSSDVV